MNDGSISIFIAKNDFQSAPDNDDIEPDRPVLHVVQIIVNTRLHFFQCFRFTSEAVNFSCAQPVIPGLILWRNM